MTNDYLITHPLVQAVLGLVLLLGGTSSVHGEEGPMRVQAQPRAGFHVSPLVHHVEARAGQEVPFRFNVRSRGGEADLQVQLVGMSQTQDGRIRHSEEAVPAGVRLETPERMTVDADQASTIRGRVVVPSDSSYVVFGILVTDLGRPVPAKPDAQNNQRRVRVNFVTQYLLRVEIRVKGGRGASVADLRVDDGTLIDREGHAVARAFLENAANTAVELEAQARLVRTEGDERVPLGPYFSLHHPIRVNEPDERRRHVRVLGGSRIAVEALVPEPVFEGDYELEVRLVSPTRRAQHAFAVVVEADEFPAQAAVVARIVHALQVTPSVLELSSGRGGNRVATLALQNVASQAVRLRVTPVPLDEGSSDAITIRPDELSLASGQRRRVAVNMTGRTQDATGRYMLLQIRVDPEAGGAGGTTEIPVALNVPANSPREAEIGEAVWLPAEGVLAVDVVNTGSSHLVLDGHAQLTDPFDRSVTLRSGFGQWLLPGQSTTVRFKPARPLPPGDYEVQLRLDVAPDAEPHTRRSAVAIP